MKTLICSTIRVREKHFAKGIIGFIMDPDNFMGSSKESLDRREKNLTQYKHSWGPAKFTRFTVAMDYGGSFEFKTDEEWLPGITTGTSGLYNPFIVREDEMQWIKKVIERLGVEYFKIRELANDGDIDAIILTGYCESAEKEMLMRCYSTPEGSHSMFEPDQFLLAASQCNV